MKNCKIFSHWFRYETWKMQVVFWKFKICSPYFKNHYTWVFELNSKSISDYKWSFQVIKERSIEVLTQYGLQKLHCIWFKYGSLIFFWFSIKYKVLCHSATSYVYISSFYSKNKLIWNKHHLQVVKSSAQKNFLDKFNLMYKKERTVAITDWIDEN